jgi:Tol biopolymer transport system component
MFLVDSNIATITSSVEDESGYAFSPDGSHLAFMEYNREIGQANLFSLDLTARQLTALGTLPIPKGSGSSIPDTANLRWSADGKFIVFDFGGSPEGRAVYLAHADGSELIKLVDSAYAPTISEDGNCLAYISNKQVFLLDLRTISSTSTTVLLADLPTGRGSSDYRLDKLQWSP